MRLTFQPQDIHHKPHHVDCDIDVVKYVQRILVAGIRGNLVRTTVAVFCIHTLAFGTQPEPTPAIRHGRAHSRQSRHPPAQ